MNEDPQEFLEEVYKRVEAIGVTYIEKAELAGYQLKDVAQVRYTQWKDNRPIRAGLITWEIFKKAFQDKFFPHEKREAKVEEFINLRQGDMSFQEYSLKFTKLFEYAPSLVANQRDKMSHFVIGVYDAIEEECCVTMLHDNMDISRLMVHAQQVEESRIRKKSTEVRRARPEDGYSSKVCGKKHEGKCLTGMGVFYGCGKSGHQLKDFPTRTNKGRKCNQTTPSGSNADAPKKNHLNALQSRSDQDGSPNVVTGMLQVFSINVYALLDPGATISIVTPFVAMKFEVSPE
ncbi:uncharacterized protein LOC125813510 [Solanum verrucosum]|uniref:uncharacterized protein LOC125813510 n=1 Tax=Solanum verrucosum TaxID=315347 RepID=UPI0020D096FE|nr:uncharacterized protein LOC125813510 [Solanum verrucosum]